MSRESLRHAHAVANRLSLRQPLRESLLLLDRVGDMIRFDRSQDVDAALEAIRTEFPQVEDFERDFPSLCFAIATGVGKTRLMAAFAAYLYRAHEVRHFFILAPNLTIYEKLINDFSPGHDKYVLEGLAEFAQNPPEIITGDNYESGRGVRRESDLFSAGEIVHFNIFNISKINSEVRGGKAPRIKRLSEYIGQSYFEYLSELDDLVLMMDESHRYRASAGVAAINELQPVLGLELTATPRTEARGGQEFRNVIYRYPLSAAMDDGYVKEPAVATRESFDPAQYSGEQLERLKLEDGVRVHENVKVELEVFARQNGLRQVKPFMLVVATDTRHADDLVRLIESGEFFDGRYRNKVIQVHSNQRGEEKEETIERLLRVQEQDEPTEIVVHVNKLKEGWDVNNLYTIVPLRAAKSQILTEQTIGRGLRLPYGHRTGVPAVDRLTIIAHDQFQAIIDEANEPGSIIREGLVIGRDILDEGRKAVSVAPVYESRLFGSEAAIGQAPDSREESTSSILETPAAIAVGRTVLDVIRRNYEQLPRSDLLLGADVRRSIAESVRTERATSQGTLTGFDEQVDIDAVVEATTDELVRHSIDIPAVTFVPADEVIYGFREFELDCSSIRLQPVSEDILIQHLRSQTRHYLHDGSAISMDGGPESLLVRALTEFDDVSYDHHAELLYKLAGQAVSHLRGYLNDEDSVLNVVQYHNRAIARMIYEQMQENFEGSPVEYRAIIVRGFRTFGAASFSVPAREEIRDFRETLSDPQSIRNYLFGGFKRCVYPVQRFHSDAERRFAILLEDDRLKPKWLKPPEGSFRIHFSHRSPAYEPDFVVETDEGKYLCEPKRADQLNASDVRLKADAAISWCKHATEHEANHGDSNSVKRWTYVLIPHDEIQSNVSFSALISEFGVNGNRS